MDERQLDEFTKQLDRFDSLIITGPERAAIIRLARLGLWAEKHGVPAIRETLTNVALDWYIQQFARDTTPAINASGIAAVIHNQEIRDRARMAFEQLREALAALPKENSTKT